MVTFTFRHYDIIPIDVLITIIMMIIMFRNYIANTNTSASLFVNYSTMSDTKNGL